MKQSQAGVRSSMSFLVAGLIHCRFQPIFIILQVSNKYCTHAGVTILNKTRKYKIFLMFALGLREDAIYLMGFWKKNMKHLGNLESN